MMKWTLALPVCCLATALLWITGSTGLLAPDLMEACYRCLCHVQTKCDTSHGCTGGYCGPFNITKIYWIDSGRVGVSEDNPDWIDCAKEYDCSKTIIEGYLQKFEKDCNGDGVIDCYDYMMINGNGGYGCTRPLNQSATGRQWLQRYSECRF